MKKTKLILVILALFLLLLSGCSTINHLEDYDIYNKSIAMDMAVPPQPTVDVDYGNPDFGEDQLAAIIQVGTNIIKSVQTDKAEDKLYSALEGLYIPEYAAELTFDRIVKILDGEMIREGRDANLILEIDIRKYGLEASSWGGNVSMIFEIQTRFYHPDDNKVIWQRNINIEKELSPSIFGFNQIIGDVVSIAALNELSEEELAEGFQTITYDVMEETINKLRKDLRKARD